MSERSNIDKNDIYIKTEGLCFSYESNGEEKNIPVLRGIDVEIRKGEYVAVLGHNGSGKSTFAKLLNMILEASEGKIFIDGKEITSPDMTDDEMFELRKNVGMVFQNPDNQLVATIVEEDVAFGPENLGVPTEEIRKRVDDALDAVGMREYARHEPHRLSGGQKQRVAVAGIIAMLPECMIFDEATAMLDPSGRKDIMDTIEMLNREKGITVLNITHYMNEAARADRIIIIDNGRILDDGTPEEIFSKPEMLISAGLDVPQCSSLVHKLRRDGIELEGRLATPDDCADMICAALGKK